MENSMFRFVAVSIAVVFLFSCATLDDEIHDTHEIRDTADEPDAGVAVVELLDAETESPPSRDLPEPATDTAAHVDDELPRLTPPVAEPTEPEQLPFPGVPAATVASQTGEAPVAPTPAAPEIEPEIEPEITPEPEKTPEPDPVPAPLRSAPEPPSAERAPAERPATERPAGERPPVTPAPSRPTPEPPVAAAPTPPARRAEDKVGESSEREDPAVSDRPEIETGVMTEVNVVFPGFGWVYAGAESAGSGKVEFLRSDRTDDGTTFVFRMTETGRYTLSFQRQDLTRGEFVDESVAVTARDDQQFVDTADIASGGGDSSAAAPEAPEQATVRPESPGSPPIDVAPRVDPRVVFDNALVDGDAERAVAAVRDIPIAMVGGADVVRLARLLERNGDVVGAIEFYEQALSREPFGTDIAEILFALGALYERESERRSIRRSHGYYQRVVTEYPFSRLRDDARRRAAYLERYFLTVR